MIITSFQSGQELPEHTMTVNREKLRAYAMASGDHNPIHLDEEFAKSVGLPNVIAHGMYTMALAGEAIRLWVGSDKDILEFSTRFTKPVVVASDRDTTITFSGRVGEVSESEVTVEVTALCEGVKVLGQTKARIRL
ncbi:MAG: MaoC/PaaZ C-terminal domain-containing protein [Actinomycetota bacterium]